MDRFWELLEKNTLISSFIAAAMVATACVMWGMQIPIPKTLETALVLVLGYFLGSKIERANRK